ncbi:MAG: SlyX family protein [Opitutae bacterium]|nr:SlyX family protein [Opitutae bacterium]
MGVEGRKERGRGEVYLGVRRILRVNAAMNDSERLTRLEERYVHLQRHVGEQDKAMLEFAEELAKLRQELAMLRAQRAAPAEGGESREDERPPHY